MTIGLLSNEERAKADRVPGVTFVDVPAGRRAHVIGSGLDVFEIIRDYRNLGSDRDLLLSELDWIEPRHIDIAIAYFRAFPGEIAVRLKRETQLRAEAIRVSDPTSPAP